MANDVSYLKIISVDERKDRESGEIRIYAQCEEILPRQHNINLSRQSAAYINQLRSLQGRTVIMQTREGVFNDRAFLSISGPLIVPVDASAAAVVTPSADTLEAPKETAKPLFGKSQ